MKLTKENIIQEIADFWNVSPESLSLEDSLKNDLGLDSLDQIELLMHLEDTFNLNVPYVQEENFKTIEDFITKLPTINK